MTNIYNAIQNLYNMDKETWQEVLSEMYTLVNNTSLKFDTFEQKFLLHLGNEVTKELKKMYANGSLASLINDVLLQDINEKVDTFKTEVNEQVDTFKTEVNEQLEHIASIELNLLHLGFKFDGSDESDKFNQLLSNELYANKNITIIFPYGRTIILKNIVINTSKFIIIKGNNCIINGNNNEYVFVNNGNTALLNVENLILNGDIGLCNFEINASTTPSNATKLYARNIEFKGSSNTAIGIYMKATDFFSLENVVAWNLHTLIKIDSDVINGDRSNTQIFIKNVNLHYTKYGMYLNGVDKLTCIGFDCNRVSTGVIFNKYVTRATFINFHCEYFGNYETGELDGCGILFLNKTNKNIKFQESTVFLPATNAKYGIFMPGEYANDEYFNQVKFDNCRVNTTVKDGYVPLNLNGAFEWASDINGYTNQLLKLYTPNNKLFYGRIKPCDSFISSPTILGFNKVTSIEEFSQTEGGTPTISGTTISNTSGSLSKVSLVANLKSGWHTFIFNGRMYSNKLTIQMRTDPFTTIFSQVVDGLADYTNIVYFYVEQEHQYKICFEISNNSKIDLNYFSLHKGFKSDF